MILSAIAERLKRRSKNDLSGEVPVNRHLPHRSRRAALLQWALQDGPEAD